MGIKDTARLDQQPKLSIDIGRIYTDGSTEVSFSDACQLALDPSGSAFVYTNTDGKHLRQMSEFATSQLAPYLLSALEFRNLHVDLPYYCTALTRHRQLVNLAYCITEVLWPRSMEDGVAACLISASDPQRLVLKSLDKMAAVTLHVCQQRFAVCYPLLLSRSESGGGCVYTWHTQVFPVATCTTSRWYPAIHLLMQLAHNGHLPPEYATAQPTRSSTKLPAALDRLPLGSSALVNLGHNISGGTTATSNTTVLNSKMPTGKSNALKLPADSYPSTPPAPTAQAATGSTQLLQLLFLEWTPEATYMFEASRQEVTSWVHEDESLLRTSRAASFVSQTFGNPPQERVFPIDQVPPSLASAKRKYPLQRILQHCLKIRQEALLKLQMQQSTQADVDRISPPPTACDLIRAGGIGTHSETRPHVAGAPQHAQVLEEQVVEGYGKFVAYSNHRVTAFFDDGTLLQLNCTDRACKVMLPDSSVYHVSADTPLMMKPYVDAANQFATWAFCSLQRRQEIQQTQAMVEAQLAKNSRMAAICAMASGKTSAGSSSMAHNVL